jgi:dihydrodipicolinate synthase/N-acetylneuraminate lyase
VADIATALVSGGAGLVGALIGAFSAQLAARKTRESDRRKRCVDRVLAAITQLENAYAKYVAAAAGDPDEPHLALPLQGALRAYNQAVEMLHIPSLRTAAKHYRDQLTEFYLLYGQPRDPLDADREVPTLQQLNDEHVSLS